MALLLAAAVGSAFPAQSIARDRHGGDAGSSRQQPLALGLAYVAPPHLPGAKVRTPEGMAPILVERLAKHTPVQVLQQTTGGGAPRPAESAAPQLKGAHSSPDAFLIAVQSDAAAATDKTIIPTGYRAGIMAIMRTDTDIRAWNDLRGRTVCLTEQSGAADQLQRRYGAIAKVFQAPADALVALRIGDCDAAVHDSTMLNALLQFPEWQKFSARLPVQQERSLAFVVPRQSAELAQYLRDHVRQWEEGGVLNRATEQAARDIAFEVYMEQEVPDCH